MALIDEDKLQGNVIQLLEIARKNRACCDGVGAALWAESSTVGGPVFLTISKGGTVKVYTQPGGDLLLPDQYGTLTPAV